MKQQQVYNLKEFAARHHLESIFGAYAAHIYIPQFGLTSSI